MNGGARRDRTADLLRATEVLITHSSDLKLHPLTHNDPSCFPGLYYVSYTCLFNIKYIRLIKQGS